MPPFSSHNIVLPDGTQTAPQFPLVARSAACQAALHELNQAFEAADRAQVTIADLGCLEGGYAAEFARAGYDVTGIEARPENYDCATWLPQALGLPHLRFILGDVREVLPGRQFDAVFCSGLLYHLDRPVTFLNLLGQVTRRLLILNTHYSLEGGHPEASHSPARTWCEYGDFRHEGRAGHWCHEDAGRYDSYGNTDSFWLRKDDLLLSIEAAGFTRVSERPAWREQGDSAHVLGGPGNVADRSMFVAVK